MKEKGTDKDVCTVTKKQKKGCNDKKFTWKVNQTIQGIINKPKKTLLLPIFVDSENVFI